MKLNKYNNFLLESILQDLLLESKLRYMSDFRSTINDLLRSNDVDIKKVSHFLLNVCDKDFKTTMNLIGVDSEDKISFVPDSKIKESLDYVQIRYFDDSPQVVSNHPIIDEVEIPRLNLHYNIYNKVNKWKVIKTIDCTGTYSRYILYYLQNADDKDYYVVSMDDSYGGNDRIKGIEPYQEIPENRSNVKIGRFINKLLDLWDKDKKDDSFDRSGYTPAMIEKFVNLYSATFLFDKNIEKNLEIVSGEDIGYWYKESNYEKVQGQLGSSCMRYLYCSPYLDIYVENPEVCSLIILLNLDRNKILGRALLWIDVDGNKLIDRIYTIKDSYINIFKKWASDNKYTEIYNRQEYFKVNVKNKNYKQYPYMDSLSIFKFSEKENFYQGPGATEYSAHLTTNVPENRVRPYYELSDTDGDFDRYN